MRHTALTLALAALTAGPLLAQQAAPVTGGLHMDYGRFDTGSGDDWGWNAYGSLTKTSPEGDGLGWSVGLDVDTTSIGPRDLRAAPYASLSWTGGAHRVSAGLLRSAADKFDQSPLVRGIAPAIDRYGATQLAYSGLVTTGNLADGQFYYGLGYDGSFGQTAVAATVQVNSATDKVVTEVAASYDMGSTRLFGAYQNYDGTDIAALGLHGDFGRGHAGARLAYNSGANDHRHFMLYGDLDVTQALSLAASVQWQGSDETVSVSGRYAITPQGFADVHLMKKDGGQSYAGIGMGFNF